MSVRVAAVDCGTNSLRLLVADVDRASGTLVDVDRRMRVVRLGQGVDRTGRLADEALDRAFAVVDEYATACRDLGVRRLRFVATSATRDAQNRDAFTGGVRARLDVDPEVISGREEAELSYAGATVDAPGALDLPALVVDVGGGSTEVVRGRGAALQAACSVDVGCVRLTERHLHDDPPTAGQVAAAQADVDRALDDVAARVPLAGAGTLIGLAGTVATVSAIALGLDAYDSSAIHGSRVAVVEVLDTCDRLLAMSRAQRSALPVVHPGRADVLGGGALVWRSVVARVTRETGITEVVASERDILDGVALALGGRP